MYILCLLRCSETWWLARLGAGAAMSAASLENLRGTKKSSFQQGSIICGTLIHGSDPKTAYTVLYVKCSMLGCVTGTFQYSC